VPYKSVDLYAQTYIPTNPMTPSDIIAIIYFAVDLIKFLRAWRIRKTRKKI